MAHLVERSLPIPEVCSLKLVIGKIYIQHLFCFNCIEKTKIKRKRRGMAHFKKHFIWVFFYSCPCERDQAWYFLYGPFPAIFFFIFVFSSVYSKHMVCIKFCLDMDSSCADRWCQKHLHCQLSTANWATNTALKFNLLKRSQCSATFKIKSKFPLNLEIKIKVY